MSNKYVDIKVTTWQRLHFNDDADLKQVIEKLEQGYHPNELFDEDGLGYEGTCEVLFDTEEFIRPDENDGQSTIEVWEDGNVLWDNSFESEVSN